MNHEGTRLLPGVCPHLLTETTMQEYETEGHRPLIPATAQVWYKYMERRRVPEPGVWEACTEPTQDELRLIERHDINLHYEEIS